MTKTCSKCGQEKSATLFSARARSLDGLQAWCKDCTRERNRTWLAEHPGKAYEYTKRWMKNHPEQFKEVRRANRARWSPERRERELARIKNWRIENPELARASQQATIEKNPELYRDIARRRDEARRARKVNAFVEQVSHMTVWERDKGICGICKAPADPTDWHLDHVVPLAKDGLHWYANVQVSHPRCNLIKGAS